MTERDRFEYAWREEYPLHESTIFRRSGLNPDAYVNTRVQDGWLMWQSCSAAHSAGAQGAPSYEAEHVSLKHKDGRFTLTLVLAAVESSPKYLVTPVNPCVVRVQPQPMPQTDAARDAHIDVLRDAATLIAKHTYPTPDKPNSAWETLQRLRAEIERLDRAKGK